jgi:molybdopterin-containing oxidoreductase family membrane subunit
MSDPALPVTERPDDPPVIAPGHNYRTVTERISDAVLARPLTRGWLLGFAIVFSGMMMLLVALTWLVLRGVGIWGINIPVAWGFAIINFVWWIGIGHAGTLISAILLLLKQDWRTGCFRIRTR